MQKNSIQLPAGDFIDLWDLTRLIAKAICPSLREINDHSWLQRKLEKLPESDFETQSDMTALERASLLHLLPGLPARAGMSKEEREAFMNAYLTHPDRFSWQPVFMSEEEVAANSFEVLRIQEKHLLALQQEIASGRIDALDQHHINETRTGKNIFIRREDALHYLKQQRLRTTFDSPALAGKSTPKLILKGDLGALEAASHQAVQENHVAFGEGADILCPSNRTAQPRPEVAPAPFEPSGQLPTSTTKSRSAKNKAFKFEQPQDDKPATPALPPLTILRRKQVEERTGLSRSAIYDRMDPSSPRHDPSFPKQIKLSASASGWVESEIEAWLKGRMAARSKPS